MTQLNIALPDAESGSILRLRIPSEPRYAQTVRNAIISFAAFHHVAEDDLDALLVAVGEALANAFGYASSVHDIEIVCNVDDRRVIAQVLDAGVGCADIPTGEVAIPEPLAERGRGIPLMQHFTDIFAVDSLPGRGTVVTLGRYRRTP